MPAPRTHRLPRRATATLVIVFMTTACGTTIARDVDPGRDALGTTGAVTAGHPLAAEAGLRVLEAGGLAMDAAITAAAVLAVARPHMNGVGGDTFLRPDVLGYHVQPVGLGQARLYLKGRATALVGETLAQDYVGLARYDDIDLQVPLVGALTLGDAERVRGYRSYAVGTRALFGSAELRMPILFDLQTTVLGLARFGPVAPSLFADAGLVWTGSDVDNAARRVGVGAEVANLVSLGGFEFRHALGLAIPASRLDEVWNGTLPFDDVDVTYRIQAAVPF